MYRRNITYSRNKKINKSCKPWQKLASKFLSQFQQKKIQKCIEKIANIARITNSTRIARCSRNLLANFSRSLGKICCVEIACRNLKKSAKIAKVAGHFIATTKNTLINIARKFRLTLYKEKGKEGPIEVRDFCEMYGLFKVLLRLVIFAILSMFVTRSFQITRKFLVTFAIFTRFAHSSRLFFAFSLFRSRILLNLFFLFLRYLQVSVS